MAALPSDLLARPAVEAVRILALAYLDAAAAAEQRLGDPEDEEALHDFRVALRRLRSTVRAYRAQFRESLRPKLRRLLRRLAAATNRGRDLEVQLGWVRDQLSHLDARERTGARWLTEHLETRRQEEYARVTNDVRRDFAALGPKLRKRLSAYRQELAVDNATQPAAFAEVAAAAARRLAGELGERLAAVESVADAVGTHRTRITAKRLRYLLEPLGLTPPGPALVRRLTALQDLLGEFNEMHLLDTEIAEAVEMAAAERARHLHELAIAGESPAARRAVQRRRDERPGLVALARRGAARRGELFKRFAAEWLAGQTDVVLRQVEEVAASLKVGRPKTEPTLERGPAGTRRYRRGAKRGWQA